MPVRMFYKGRLSRSDGFTLVEVLIVTVIIGIRLGLTLMATHSARESVRSMTCQSNLRQLALGLSNHESAFGKFPSNGWGAYWVGDPDAGALEKQPGCWLYSVLPYVEQSAIWAKASGKSPSEKLIALSESLESRVPVMVCPSRRGTELSTYWGTNPLRNALLPTVTFKTDYAGNGGTFSYNRLGPGGGSSTSENWLRRKLSTGAFFIHTSHSTADFFDGLSNVFLIGDKYVRTKPTKTPPGRDIGDDQGAFVGNDVDNRRFGYLPPAKDGPGEGYELFGSRHASAVNMCMCDGSCRSISYVVDRKVFHSLSNRLDGTLSVDF